MFSCSNFICINQIRRMLNFKTQYRWLLFILVPFILILAIHITIPLVFLFESQPLAVESYTNENIHNLITTLRSFVILQSEKMSMLLGTYVSFLNVASSSLQKNNTFFQIDPLNLPLNNAYEFYQSSNSSFDTHPQSMWFASGALSYSDLNQMQKEHYNHYLNVEPLIRFNFKQNVFQQVVEGVYISFNLPGNEICFHYPSYKEQAFGELNSTILTYPYEQYLKASHQNQDVMMIQHFGVSHFHKDTMSICTSLLNTNSSIIGIICLDVNMQFLMDDLTTAIFVLERETIRSTAFLLEPAISSQEPTIIAQATVYNSQLSISYPSNQTYSSLQGSQNDVWSNQLCNAGKNLAQSFTTLRMNDSQIDIVPICVNQGESGWSPLMYYSLQFHVSDLITNLNNSSEAYKNFRNTLLITSIIAIVVFLLISVCVLKMLLKDLDGQLYKLHKCCKFIANGDINIKIPEYNGTKDIALVYEQIKTINKLFIYTSNQYFSGHYSAKILKYTEAIQLFIKINYDPSYLYQNLGSVYMFVEEYSKAISYLKQSVDMLLEEIEEEYGDLDKLVKMKTDKRVKLTNCYKRQQIILVRRLWKLNFAYVRYLDLGILKSHNFRRDSAPEESNIVKREKYISEMMKYANKFKQAVFPDFGTYAEAILLFLNQAKFHLNMHNTAGAKSSWEKAVRYCSIYTKQYDGITEKLKQKGSKNKLFFKKNRLCRHSRTHPHILKSFCQYIQALLQLSAEKNKNHYSAICILTDALKKTVLSQTVNYSIVILIRQILKDLEIDADGFESTQIFREVLPQKILNYDCVTPEIQQSFYKPLRNYQEPSARQYVLMYDTGHIAVSSRERQKLFQYFQETTDLIFDKFINGKDRISLAKFNSNIQLETLCNLTIKQSHQHVLKKTFVDILRCSEYKGKSWLVEALSKVIFRIKKLQSEKIVIIFLRPLQSYVNDQLSKSNRSKRRNSPPNLKKTISNEFGSFNSMNSAEELPSLEEIGTQIVDLMCEQGMKNCKVILLSSKGEDCSEVVTTLGLKDINRRIWAHTKGINKNNNVVFLNCQRHKIEIERILISKVAHYIDNHTFIF